MPRLAECDGRHTPAASLSCPTSPSTHSAWRASFLARSSITKFDDPLLLFVIFALGLVGPAVFLLLGLVRPWGMKFPRWTLWLAGRRVPRILPLSPVFLVAPTLALYGVGSVPYAVVTGQGDQLWGIGGAASLAFGTYGCALAVAAVSYQRRNRPRCRPLS